MKVATLFCTAVLVTVSSANIFQDGATFAGSMFEATPIHKKLKAVAIEAKSMDAWGYGQFFIGMFTVGTTDVLKNFRHVWPCIGDVANIAEAGFDVYKYMDQYIKTDNTFMIINAFSRGIGGAQIGLDWKCGDRDPQDLILRNTSSHEFAGMPHAPQHLSVDLNMIESFNTDDNSIISGDSMQRNAYDTLISGGKGMNIKDIIQYFGQVKFVTGSMTATSELWNIDTMLKNNSYFTAGSTTG